MKIATNLSKNSHVKMYDFRAFPPATGVQRHKKISKNFTSGEFYDATFFNSDELVKNVITGEKEKPFVPIDDRVVNVVQYLRDFVKKPVYLNSVYRTESFEKSKGRNGNSQHTYARAVDVSGIEVVRELTTAITTQNQLFKSLRNKGVNGFGIYPDFIHLDFRPAKADGGFYLWKKKDKEDEDTKGSKSFVKIGIALGVLLVVLGGKKIIKSISKLWKK